MVLHDYNSKKIQRHYELQYKSQRNNVFSKSRLQTKQCCEKLGFSFLRFNSTHSTRLIVFGAILKRQDNCFFFAIKWITEHLVLKPNNKTHLKSILKNTQKHFAFEFQGSLTSCGVLPSWLTQPPTPQYTNHQSLLCKVACQQRHKHLGEESFGFDLDFKKSFGFLFHQMHALGKSS